MVLFGGISRAQITVLAFFLLSSTALLAGESDTPEYQRLLGGLQQYERIAESGGWPTVPAGPTIRPGDGGPRIAALARRLAITGDLDDAGPDDPLYDESLQQAVVRFQLRHGLEPDALVGRATLRALNVPAPERSAQLQRNLPPTSAVFGPGRPDFVLVNIPAFEVYLYRDHEKVWTGRVIVGETGAETPLLESAIRFVVLNPTWTVPYSISSEELLPKIKADPGFLARGNYELRNPDGNPVDPSGVDWAALNSNNFPYTLVQRAGPGNELGRVKFLFPNEYGVCMHDTNKKQLFAVDLRALSHGCIRVAEPLELAATLLEAEGWTRNEIDAQLAAGQTRTIELAQPLPFVVAYLTAMVDEAGTVFFYRDVYELLGTD